MERNHIIDNLRFFAAAMVVFFHLNQPIHHIDNWYRNLVKYGWLGVPVFFVISGYCIIISANRSTNGLDFLGKRLFRIFPAYWLSLLIVLLIAVLEKVFTGYNSVAKMPNSVASIVANITLTTAPFSSVKTINWVYWSLTYEVFFYIIIACVLTLNKRFTEVGILGITLLSIWPTTFHTQYLFFLNFWPIFSSGICIFYWFNYTGKYKYPYLILLSGITAFALYKGFLHQPLYLGTTLLTSALIVVSRYIKLKSSIFSTLGEHSYSVYLLHVPIGVYVLKRFETDYIQSHLIANIAYDIATYIIVSLMAWQTFNLVEQPANQYGKKLLKWLFSKPDSTITTQSLSVDSNHY